MRPFEFLVGELVSRKLLTLPAEEQWEALRAFEALANHPVTTGLPHWVGEDGVTRYLCTIHGDDNFSGRSF
jgi:hypothetical protein